MTIWRTHSLTVRRVMTILCAAGCLVAFYVLAEAV